MLGGTRESSQRTPLIGGDNYGEPVLRKEAQITAEGGSSGSRDRQCGCIAGLFKPLSN